MLRISYLVIFCILASTACGRPAISIIPWQKDFYLWFPDASLKPIEPERLFWNRDEEDRFLRRIGYADCAILGTVRGVGTYRVLGRPKHLYLWISTEEIFFGREFLPEALDQDKDLFLRLDPSTAEFWMAFHAQRNLPRTRYVIFLKQQPLPHREKVWHWSLYHQDPRLLMEIRAIYSWYKKKPS